MSAKFKTCQGKPVWKNIWQWPSVRKAIKQYKVNRRNREYRNKNPISAKFWAVRVCLQVHGRIHCRSYAVICIISKEAICYNSLQVFVVIGPAIRMYKLQGSRSSYCVILWFLLFVCVICMVEKVLNNAKKIINLHYH